MGQVYDEKGVLVTPTPKRSIPLNSAFDVRKELGRLYNDARRGRIEASEATKLAYILNILRTTIETSDLEARLEALESNQTKGGA